MRKILDMVMHWWAKISSIVMIYSLFYSTYFSLKLINISIKVMSYGYNVENIFYSIIQMILALVLGLIGGIIVYSPFIYYGWFKNKNNKSMKSMIKSITIFLPIFILIFSISYTSKFSDIIPILTTIFSMVPLYYYAWGK